MPPFTLSSRLLKVLSGISKPTLPGPALKNLLSRAQVKPREIFLAGLNLDEPVVDVQSALQTAERNLPKVKAIKPQAQPRYGEYTSETRVSNKPLRGYAEDVLIADDWPGNYRSSHWTEPDVENPIVHSRSSTQIIPEASVDLASKKSELDGRIQTLMRQRAQATTDEMDEALTKELEDAYRELDILETSNRGRVHQVQEIQSDWAREVRDDEKYITENPNSKSRFLPINTGRDRISNSDLDNLERELSNIHQDYLVVDDEYRYMMAHPEFFPDFPEYSDKLNKLEIKREELLEIIRIKTKELQDPRNIINQPTENPFGTDDDYMDLALKQELFNAAQKDAEYIGMNTGRQNSKIFHLTDDVVGVDWSPKGTFKAWSKSRGPVVNEPIDPTGNLGVHADDFLSPQERANKKRAPDIVEYNVDKKKLEELLGAYADSIIEEHQKRLSTTPSKNYSLRDYVGSDNASPFTDEQYEQALKLDPGFLYDKEAELRNNIDSLRLRRDIEQRHDPRARELTIKMMVKLDNELEEVRQLQVLQRTIRRGQDPEQFNAWVQSEMSKNVDTFHELPKEIPLKQARGMRVAYDQKLPVKLEKYLKRLGFPVVREHVELTPGYPNPVWKLSPELKQWLLNNDQELFQILMAGGSSAVLKSYLDAKGGNQFSEGGIDSYSQSPFAREARPF